MKIALDAMGGDKAPQATVEGAALALQEFGGDLEKLILVGDESTLRSQLSDISYAHSKSRSSMRPRWLAWKNRR